MNPRAADVPPGVIARVHQLARDTYGARVLNCVNRETGRTPLLTACDANVGESHYLTIEFILGQPGVQVNFRAAGTLQTGLHLVVETGMERLVRMMVAGGVDTSIRDARGRTALYEAIESVNFPVVRELLQRGTPVNLIDEEGLSPLHVASAFSSVRVCQLLVQFGANPLRQNFQGLVPSLYALSRENLRFGGLRYQYLLNQIPLSYLKNAYFMFNFMNSLSKRNFRRIAVSVVFERRFPRQIVIKYFFMRSNVEQFAFFHKLLKLATLIQVFDLNYRRNILTLQ